MRKNLCATMRSALPITWRVMPTIWTDRPDHKTLGRIPMADAAVQEKKPAAPAPEAERELTDGFHLIIDALKLNDIKTIYGVPGIPITDFGRMAQAEIGRASCRERV